LALLLSRFTKEMEMNFTDNVREIWTKQIINEKGIIIMSPYLSAFILKVIGEQQKNIKVIYTKCNLIDFYQGASNLEVLIKLAELGIQIRVIKNLHAKVFISKSLATIGSQNATTNSENLFELSAITRSTEEIKKVRKEIKAQEELSKVVTKEFLLEIKARLDAYEPRSEIDPDILNASKELDEQLFNNDFQDFMTEQLMNNSSLAIKSDSTKTIEHFPSKKFKKQNEYYAKNCLLQDNGADYDIYDVLVKSHNEPYLTEWKKVRDNQMLHLEAMHRYLIVNNVTGALGWAKIATTRINFIESGLYFSGELIKHCGSEFKVVFSSASNQRGNMELELSSTKSNSNFTLFVKFDLFEMKLSKKPKFKEDKNEPFSPDFFSEDKFKRLLNKLSKLATGKFKYGKNNSGKHITDYFDGLPKYSRLYLREIGNNPVLFLDYEC
jgi:hypothetical protein